eukprot:286944-Chlamydomonas_euryale.AAC.7
MHATGRDTTPQLMHTRRLNPLGVDASNFLIAEDADGGRRLGFGQLERKASSMHELRSVVVEPDARCGMVRSMRTTARGVRRKSVCAGCRLMSCWVSLLSCGSACATGCLRN